ncbi:histidinol-phosphate transaminase [Micrococcus porci]|uniref:histidinol-phosphate transaminase n=1 Tax=Micrococcus porci TaxID=2856555 RepID=UPI001CCF4A75|nr:histidinol-phosphate transaminase [Micrococcus porci]UBH24306.1 histidinol-phosphate transaminase [Micrococcus porci]
MTDLSSLPLRDSLRGQSPYGAPQLDVPYMLNTNENTHPVPQAVAEAITARVAKVAGGLNRYPDREFTELREHLAAYLGHGITPEQVWAANGSNEVLQQILQAFGGPGRTLLSFLPSYSMYPLLANGTDTAFVDGGRAADHTLSAEHAAALVREHRPNVVFLASPNNPTGTALGLDVIEAIYAAQAQNEAEGGHGAMVVVDEAYAEFALAGTDSALTLLRGRERLIVTRTMSKAFALAGARLGYLAADAAVADALRLVRLPYHLSAVTQATAIAALERVDELLETVEDIKGQRDRIVAELTGMGLVPAVSDSNFVFFGRLADAHAVWEALLERGVLVRDVGIPHHLRVTAGTEEETTAFLDALREIVEQDPAVVSAVDAD